jgi:hypothetical protein
MITELNAMIHVQDVADAYRQMGVKPTHHAFAHFQNGNIIRCCPLTAMCLAPLEPEDRVNYYKEHRTQEGGAMAVIDDTFLIGHLADRYMLSKEALRGFLDGYDSSYDPLTSIEFLASGRLDTRHIYKVIGRIIRLAISKHEKTWPDPPEGMTWDEFERREIKAMFERFKDYD